MENFVKFTGKDLRGRRELITVIEIVWRDIKVPIGFKSDGASTPEFADNVFGFDPLNTLYLKAAVVHDYLYASGIVPRKEADRIFLKIILEAERPWRKKLFFGIIMFTAVRFKGKEAYDRYNS